MRECIFAQNDTEWSWSAIRKNTIESIDIMFFSNGNFAFIHICEDGTNIDVDSAAGQYALTMNGVCFPLNGDTITGRCDGNTMHLTFSDGEPLGGVFLQKH